MRIFVECTYVFDHPDMNSGIQRVVRNIVDNLQYVKTEHEVLPVIIVHGAIYRVKERENRKTSWLERRKRQLAEKLHWANVNVEKFRHRYWVYHSRIEQRYNLGQHKQARRMLL